MSQKCVPWAIRQQRESWSAHYAFMDDKGVFTPRICYNPQSAPCLVAWGAACILACKIGIVICHCQRSPIESVLEPLPKAQVTADSFGGSEEEYQEYLERNSSGVEVG